MRLRHILIMPAVLLLTLGLAGGAMANTGPGIRIDGKLRQVEPPPQITASRTMIPIRFVIEDEALNGQVYWDAGLKKVAMDVRGQYIEFFIGDNKAEVDGQIKYFDAAPYIYKDRTYIPLRFLAENLGAAVDWKEAEQEVIIDFRQPLPGLDAAAPPPAQEVTPAQEAIPTKKVIIDPQHPPEVFAYYYYARGSELQDNLRLFTDIAFRWFKTNPKGELFYEYEDDYEKILQMAREAGVRTHASVVLMGKDPLHRLLSSKRGRASLIGNLLDEVKKNNYDGINIDFEIMAYRDAGRFNSFLQELKTAMGEDKILSVAAYARTGKESWLTPYQYTKIGQIADRVVVMAYDYSYSTSKPGPVAPLWWVEEVIAYMTDRMPREKILLGLPTYGYDWSPGTNAATITAKKLAEIERRYEVQKYFDQDSMSPYYIYYDEKGRRHEIWLENERSLNEKWAAALENRLAGISFWRIGNGFDDLYRLLDKSFNQ